MSVFEQDIDQPFSIYPIPATAYIMIDIAEEGNYDFILHDLPGKIVLQQKVHAGINQLVVENLSAAWYSYQLKNTEGFIRAGRILVK